MTFTAPASTGSTLTLDGIEAEVLPDASVASCSYVVSSPDGTALAQGMTDANGAASVSVETTQVASGFVATCLPATGSVVGMIMTDAVTASASYTADSPSTATLSLVSSQVYATTGTQLIDTTTGKLNSKVTFGSGVDVPFVVKSYNQTIQGGDSTASGGKKAAAILASIMKSVVAGRGDPVAYAAKLMAEDATTLTDAASRASASVVALTDLIEILKGARDLINTVAADSTSVAVTGARDAVVSAVINAASATDINSIKAAPAGTIVSTLTSLTNVNSNLIQAIGGIFAQSALDSYKSLKDDNRRPAILKIVNTSLANNPTATDFRGIGQACYNVGATADPTAMLSQSSNYASIAVTNLSTFKAARPDDTGIIKTINTVSSALTQASTSGASFTITAGGDFGPCPCSAGHICRDSICVPGTLDTHTGAVLNGSCTADSDCGPGLGCSSNKCLKACSANADCPSGATCSTSTHFCVASTTTPTPKTAGAACTATSECQSGLLCLGASSTAKTCKVSGISGDLCSANTDCGSGLVCNANACSAPPTTLATLSTSCMITDSQKFVTDGTNLYFTDCSSGSTVNQISSLPLSGGSKTSLIAGLSNITSINLLTSSVAYSTNGSSSVIGSCPKAGGSCSTIVTCSGTNCVVSNGISNDGTNFFFGNGTSGAGGKIQTLPVSTSGASVGSLYGSPIVILSTSTTPNIPQFGVVQGANYFFVTGSSGAYGINQVATTGGSITSLAPSPPSSPNLSSVTQLVSDGTNVCWTEIGTYPSGIYNNDGAVKCVPVGGGTITTLKSSLNTQPFGIAISGTNVYVALQGTRASSGSPSMESTVAGSGSIIKMPITSGATATNVYSGTGSSGINPMLLLIAGNNVYFTGGTGGMSGMTASTIMSVPK